MKSGFYFSPKQCLISAKHILLKSLYERVLTEESVELPEIDLSPLRNEAFR